MLGTFPKTIYDDKIAEPHTPEEGVAGKTIFCVIRINERIHHGS
jgi:hypothetical protein